MADGRAGDPEAPRALRVAAAWSWRLLVVGAAAGAVLYALAAIRIVVLPVAGALLVCTFLAPVVMWLDRRGVPRILATAAVSAGALAVAGGLLLALGLQIRDNLDAIEGGARSGLQDVEDWLVTGPLGVEREQIGDATDQALDWLTAPDGLLQAGVLSRATTAVEILGGLLLALVLVFFFLKDGDAMWRWLTRGIGPAGPHVDAAGRRAWAGLGGYMRGQAIIAAVNAVFIGAGIWLLGVPFAVPLAALTFFAAFFPIVGAFVAGSAAVLVALASDGVTTALILLAIVVAVQQTEGNVLEPVVMARTARLHPVVVLLALGAGTALGGLVGAFLAVPIAAASAAAGGYAWGRLGPGTGSGDPAAPGGGRVQPALTSAAAPRRRSAREEGRPPPHRGA